MNEVGTSLTTTGLIATIISVLFAIAAFYVSHRRRTLAGGHNAVNNLTPAPTPAAPTPTSPQAPPPQPTSTPSATPAAGGLVVANAGSSSFNRLGGRGVEEDTSKTSGGRAVYEWE